MPEPASALKKATVPGATSSSLISTDHHEEIEPQAQGLGDSGDSGDMAAAAAAVDGGSPENNTTAIGMALMAEAPACVSASASASASAGEEWAVFGWTKTCENGETACLEKVCGEQANALDPATRHVVAPGTALLPPTLPAIQISHRAETGQLYSSSSFSSSSSSSFSSFSSTSSPVVASTPASAASPNTVLAASSAFSLLPTPPESPNGGQKEAVGPPPPPPPPPPPSPPSPPPLPPFLIRPSLTAGLGAFATRALRRGEVILQEAPLFVAPDPASIFGAFGKLDQVARDKALALHASSHFENGMSRLEAIWHTNSFSTGLKREAGLFPIASRFNHACPPSNNIHYKYDRLSNRLCLWVGVDEIAAGEELKVSYGAGKKPEQLYMWYGFRCACGSCQGLSDDQVEQLSVKW